MYIYVEPSLKLMGIYLIQKFQVQHNKVCCHHMIYSSRITSHLPLLIYAQLDSPVRIQFCAPVGESRWATRPFIRATTLSTCLATAVPTPTSTRLNMNSATNDRTMMTANVTQYVLTV